MTNDSDKKIFLGNNFSDFKYFPMFTTKNTFIC